MAIDPGVSIGVAVHIVGPPHDMYITCTLTNPRELWEMLAADKPSKVVFEGFHTSNRVDTNIIHTIEIVGSLRGACAVLGIPCYRQINQERKSFIPDAREILRNGRPTPHEIDALAHLLRFEYKLKHNEVHDDDNRA